MLDVTRQHLVQAEAFRLVELLEKVRHKVLQESISVVEFEKATLLRFLRWGCFKLPFLIDVGDYGELAHFRLVFNLRAVFQDQHIVVFVIVIHIDAIDLIYCILNGKNKD